MQLDEMGACRPRSAAGSGADRSPNRLAAHDVIGRRRNLAIPGLVRPPAGGFSGAATAPTLHLQSVSRLHVHLTVTKMPPLASVHPFCRRASLPSSTYYPPSVSHPEAIPPRRSHHQNPRPVRDSRACGRVDWLDSQSPRVDLTISRHLAAGLDGISLIFPLNATLPGTLSPFLRDNIPSYSGGHLWIPMI